MRPAARMEARERYARQFPVNVGVDAGKTFHKLVACGADRVRTKAIQVDVSRAGFDGALAFLRATYPDVPTSQMLVAIEFAGHYGATFAAFLRDAGCVVVTMPATVTYKLKELEDNSPRKDDAKDAAQVCKLIGAGYFVGAPALSPVVAQLRVLATERHRLTMDETRLRNRLQAILDVAWPEFAGLAGPVELHTARALLRRWPVAADVAQAPVRSISMLTRRVSHNHFPVAKARALHAAARTSVAITSDAEARRAEIRRVLDRWDLLVVQIAAVEAELAVLVEQHPGARALTTLPGVGVVCASTLVAELGTPEGFESPRQVWKLAGMNLARKESGTSLHGRVRQTKRGRPLLRRQLFLLAGRWCQARGLYREDYLALVARNGGCKVSAICAIARRLVPLVLHIAQTGEPFDQVRWQRARSDSVLRTPPAA